MGNWTSVPVRKATRDRLENHPEKDGRDWDTFLRREVLGEDIGGDGVELNVPEGMLVVKDATEADIKRIKELIDSVPERTADELEGRFR